MLLDFLKVRFGWVLLLQGSFQVEYTRRFATTILSATQCRNIGTILHPFEMMLQRCVALKSFVVANSLV